MKANAVLSSKWETFGEIYKATKIERDELMRLIAQFKHDGQIEFGILEVRDCRVPVMRLPSDIKPIWKRGRRS